MQQQIKPTAQDRKRFAERAGELLLKQIPENISTLMEETRRHHNLQDTAENRQALRQAYKTANPRYKNFAEKKYGEAYKRGEQKNRISDNPSDEITALLGYLAIDKELSLKRIRDAIVQRFLNSETTSPIPPDLHPHYARFFEAGVNLNELIKPNHQRRSADNDEESPVKIINGTLQRALETAQDNDE